MAKIDTSTIEGYADMTPEAKLAALESFEYDDRSNEVARLKALTDKANSEAADWKRKHKALLGDDERKKQEDADRIAAMEAELNALRKEKTVADYKARYVAMGYAEDLAAESASALADGDMEAVFAKQRAFLTALEKKIKADSLRDTPRPPSGAGSKAMTREEIMSIRDNAERQDAIVANIDLFKGI